MQSRDTDKKEEPLRARAVIFALLAGFLACEDAPTSPQGAVPTARFDVDRSSGTTVFVDASGSDPGDGNSTLWVRWDWEIDGVWDTEWSETKTAVHTYGTQGVWGMLLEVGNSSRRLDRESHQIALVPILTPAGLVESLADAYRRRDRHFLADLLVNDPERDAEYRFHLSAPTDLGETQWDYAEEVRIHHRMFDPENPPPGDPPLASELWLQSLSITLTPLELFTERPDLYTTSGGPLDPANWRAVDATYTTYVFFDLVGTDYKVEGGANFVVIEDLTKNAGEPGKYLLYIWEDIVTSPPQLASNQSWSAVKSLFR